MSDDSKREWQFYLKDMIEFANKVLAYTEDLDQTKFLTNVTLRHMLKHLP